jgi:hypothetical protein
MNIVFFNIGWMESYQGITPDDSTTEGGGKWVDEHTWGHELFNFKEYNGYFYGFVQTSLHNNISSQIKIERINASFKYSDVINDVLVVWVATNPKRKGNYIVGWYKHADVYRSEQKNIKEREYGGEIVGYYAKAKKEDVVLLIDKRRTYNIPRGKGWLGEIMFGTQKNKRDSKKR